MSDNTQPTNAASGSNTTRNRRSNKKAASNTGKIIAAVILILLIAVYGGGVYYYSSHFPHNTVINHVKVGEMDTAAAEKAFTDDLASHKISLKEKELSGNMCKKITESAEGFGAEMLITACPLCLYNLNKTESGLPVYYFTELLAEALGVKEDNQ